MPSQLMDQPTPIQFPTQAQAGFWNSQLLLDQQGNKSIPGAQAADILEFSQPCLVKDQVATLAPEQKAVGAEKLTNLSMSAWRSVDHGLETRSNIFVQPASYLTESNKINFDGQYENSLFSSSLSEIFSKKLRFPASDAPFRQCVDPVTSHEEEPFESLEEIEAQTIGNLLPDDEDLLSGVNFSLDYGVQRNIGDDIEDFDLFSSGGGMELEEGDALSSSRNLRNSDFSGTNSNGQLEGLGSSIAGQHPYGERPSRTLFVRNINSNIEDSEIKALFEQYGDIRTLYTACKHRGFVMISYYDIRAACDAMRALQNKPLKRRNLDIHFSIPKDNPSEKDINQGTIVIFNLDFSVSNEELQQTFGVYGEIKEIRENPYKRHHKFIEFYDIRVAEAALCALNRSDIAGKRIKVEPSRPGSVKRCSAQLLASEIEHGEFTSYLQWGSPPNSTSRGFGSVSHGTVASSCMENDSIQSLPSSIGIGAPTSQFMENGFHYSLPPSAPQRSPSLMSAGPVGNQSGIGDSSPALGNTEYGFQRRPPFHPHSFPEYDDGLACGVTYNSPGTIGANITSKPREAITNGPIHRVGMNGHAVEPNDVFGSSNGSCPLHGQQYMWSNSNSYHPRPPNPLMWPNSSSFVNGVRSHPSQLHGFPRTSSHMLNAVLPLQHHHVGSAPTVNQSIWDRRHVYEGESHEASGFHPGSLGSAGLAGNSNLHNLDLNYNIFPHGGGNIMDLSIASPNVGLHSPQQRYHMFPRRNSMTHLPNSFDATSERVISRRSESTSSQADNKKQYELDIDLISRGEDNRTTLMIKNIPNKYTSKMLLAAIDEHHRGTYDFIYLPIDFKNKCNVGYAFINMVNPSHIVPFYQAFNGKKWEKFNSEKVASLAYARIQGKAALISHFQNSSLMNEDKRCRPILFHTDGPYAGDQEPFPMGINIRSRPSKPRTNSSDENHQGSPSTCENGDHASNRTDSSSGSAKDSE